MLYTPEKVLEDFGVTPQQIPDLKGLMGDASDNIPGIPGIGPKTAVKLLTTYGTLENALDHAETDLRGKQRENMVEGRMSGLMSKKIATITRYVPLDDVSLEDCRLGDLSGGMAMFEKLGLRTLMTRLTKLSHSQEAPASQKAETEWAQETPLDNEPAISAWLSALPKEACIALVMADDGFSLPLCRTAAALARASLFAGASGRRA